MQRLSTPKDINSIESSLLIGLYHTKSEISTTPHKSPVSLLMYYSYLFPTLSNKWHTRQSLGRISPTKALSIRTPFSNGQQENKTKYNQSLQLSVTEHFNKTILRIVLLILFTPYQEMIYPLSSHI